MFAAGAENMIPWADPPNTVAVNDEARRCMDQYQAWMGIDPAGPVRETWNKAAQEFPSGVGRPSMTRRDERRFDHRMQRGEKKCPQTRLWAQTSDGDTERGLSL